MSMHPKTAEAIVAVITWRRSADPLDGMGKIVSNVMLNDVFALAGKDGIAVPEIETYRPGFTETLQDVCFLRMKDIITTKQLKELLVKAWENPGMDLVEEIRDSGLLEGPDESAIDDTVKRIVDGNPNIVAQIKGGKTNAVGFFIGQVNKVFSGKGNPAQIREKVLAYIETL